MEDMFGWMLMECFYRLERQAHGGVGRWELRGYRGGTRERPANLYLACAFMGRSPWR